MYAKNERASYKRFLKIYEVLSNSSGKITFQVYKDKILEFVVSSWLRDSQDFVLKEDNDSGYSTSKSKYFYFLIFRLSKRPGKGLKTKCTTSLYITIL
ncbi:hypothetical protein GGTG_10814 [Gaeumannomyces tritici R3-111a-1]|uniref:Uncharacterized protein n=1 Tax=Gaeumannomyces tritici (strain R3-111a-1) TaxID=644352 RepID=J3PBE0_GAET3|nr:hypothetical protein GGTG_10814 [Gaeumannomyces tritici R3-111a-1]EJT71557.1 hypothetical protein GGTG_10814 [Gaeumannomyces tritici R3-111a-1]